MDMKFHPLGKRSYSSISATSDMRFAAILREIVKHQVSSADIAEIVGCNRNTASQMLLDLEKLGYIMKVPRRYGPNDIRVYRLYGTQERAIELAEALERISASYTNRDKTKPIEETEREILGWNTDNQGFFVACRDPLVSALFGNGPAKSYWPVIA